MLIQDKVGSGRRIKQNNDYEVIVLNLHASGITELTEKEDQKE